MLYSIYLLAYRSRLRRLYPFLNPHPIIEPPYQNQLKSTSENYSSAPPKRSISPYLKPNSVDKPYSQNELDDSYGDEYHEPLRPPTPVYGIRIRIRTYFPCSENRTFCDSLPKVDCGGIRFR